MCKKRGKQHFVSNTKFKSKSSRPECRLRAATTTLSSMERLVRQVWRLRQCLLHVRLCMNELSCAHMTTLSFAVYTLF